MKKVLEKIRSKPAEIRMMIAWILALVCILVIGGIWITTFSSARHFFRNNTAPSPIGALTGAIKDVVIKPSASTNTNTQIIEQ